MQASLVVLGGVFGLVNYSNASDSRWLLGAIVLLANFAPPGRSPPNQARDLLTRLPAEPSCQRPALRLPLADE